MSDSVKRETSWNRQSRFQDQLDEREDHDEDDDVGKQKEIKDGECLSLFLYH
jgi:hypothetical protein